MSLDTHRLDDGTLVIRPPPIVARCAACDVGILSGSPIAHGGDKFCSLDCAKTQPAGSFFWWAPAGYPAGDEPWRVTVDFLPFGPRR